MNRAASAAPACTAPATVVLDTNIVLDLWVFEDPATQALRAALACRALRWLATAAMRSELARVLDYPQIRPRLAYHQRPAQAVLARFDQQATLVPVAAKSAFTCKDPDDQGFIDLAVAHGASLISKDRAVLCMARRLARLGVRVARVWDEPGESAGAAGETEGTDGAAAGTRAARLLRT